jgi:hypothetical protein
MDSVTRYIREIDPTLLDSMVARATYHTTEYRGIQIGSVPDWVWDALVGVSGYVSDRIVYTSGRRELKHQLGTSPTETVIFFYNRDAEFETSFYQYKPGWWRVKSATDNWEQNGVHMSTSEALKGVNK